MVGLTCKPLEGRGILCDFACSWRYLLTFLCQKERNLEHSPDGHAGLDVPIDLTFIALTLIWVPGKQIKPEVTPAVLPAFYSDLEYT